MFLSTLFDELLDLLFPPRCFACDGQGAPLCAECERRLPLLQEPVCHACGQPARGQGICPDCIARPLGLKGVRGVFAYTGNIREGIHKLKYGNRKPIARPLGQILARSLKDLGWPVDVVVPVPLHSGALRERGYNQAELLARELGKARLLPVERGALVRIKEAPRQARTQSVEERFRNVAGAFVGRDHALEGKQVLLVDDVCTTGATLSACATAARQAGAAHIWGLVVARAGLGSQVV